MRLRAGQGKEGRAGHFGAGGVGRILFRPYACAAAIFAHGEMYGGDILQGTLFIARIMQRQNAQPGGMFAVRQAGKRRLHGGQGALIDGGAHLIAHTRAGVMIGRRGQRPGAIPLAQQIFLRQGGAYAVLADSSNASKPAVACAGKEYAALAYQRAEYVIGQNMAPGRNAVAGFAGQDHIAALLRKAAQAVCPVQARHGGQASARLRSVQRRDGGGRGKLSAQILSRVDMQRAQRSQCLST